MPVLYLCKSTDMLQVDCLFLSMLYPCNFHAFHYCTKTFIFLYTLPIVTINDILYKSVYRLFFLSDFVLIIRSVEKLSPHS